MEAAKKAVLEARAKIEEMLVEQGCDVREFVIDADYSYTIKGCILGKEKVLYNKAERAKFAAAYRARCLESSSATSS